MPGALRGPQSPNQAGLNPAAGALRAGIVGSGTGLLSLEEGGGGHAQGPPADPVLFGCPERSAAGPGADRGPAEAESQAAGYRGAGEQGSGPDHAVLAPGSQGRPAAAVHQCTG